ncbi:MAG: heme exporter protein CcmD [Oceanospirillaceae bacterium]|nr:heme exporter protein CcmD [Oceanospirillaceae bacterium]
MQFDSWLAFFNMGGHGLYVWLSFGIALLVLMLNIVSPLFQFKSTVQSLAKKYQRESNRQ